MLNRPADTIAQYMPGTSTDLRGDAIPILFVSALDEAGTETTIAHDSATTYGLATARRCHPDVPAVAIMQGKER